MCDLSKIAPEGWCDPVLTTFLTCKFLLTAKHLAFFVSYTGSVRITPREKRVKSPGHRFEGQNTKIIHNLSFSRCSLQVCLIEGEEFKSDGEIIGGFLSTMLLRFAPFWVNKFFCPFLPFDCRQVQAPLCAARLWLGAQMPCPHAGGWQPAVVWL
jgi:hypothetical protein